MHVANTEVGGDTLQGAGKTLSGGEKRRVSIGCSLVTNPSILMLDEPTSGLDAGMALEVMDALVLIAKKDRTVVCSIHQPRWDIFKNFDNIYFLAQGILAAKGTREELWSFYLSEFPHLPRDMKDDNIADLYLDYLSGLNETSAFEVSKRFEQYAFDNETTGGKTRLTLTKHPAEFRQRMPFHERAVILIKTKFTAHYIRRGDLKMVTGGQGIWLLISGLAFSGGSTEDDTLFGAILVVLIMLFFKGLGLVVNVVPMRRQYAHDIGMGLYDSGEYLLAVVVLEWVEVLYCCCFCWVPWSFIASLRTGPNSIFYGILITTLTAQCANVLGHLAIYTIPNVTKCNALYGGFICLLYAYSGTYCDVDRLEGYLAWIPHVNPYYYSTSGLMQNNFSGTEFAEEPAMNCFFTYNLTHCAVFLACYYLLVLPFVYLSLSYQLWNFKYDKVWKIVTSGFKSKVGLDSPSDGEKQSLIESTGDRDERKTSSGVPERRDSLDVIRGPSITWSHVQYSITIMNTDEASGPAEGKQGNEMSELANVAFQQRQKVILSDSTGVVRASTLCALMGPSGAGKTSLLHILGGKEMPGQVIGTLPELDYDDTGFVWQEDVLEPTCTVKESFRFYADLKLPANTRLAYRKEMVEKVLVDLGLDPCKDTIVGGTSVLASVKTLSGGQRRRVSIGCAIVTNPSCVLLDEPTSGLDAGMSLEVMESMVNLRMTGRTVLASIHQPRAEIFKMFDQVIFLAMGYIVYGGPPTLDGISPLYGAWFEGRDMSRLNLPDLMLDRLSGMESETAMKLREDYKRYEQYNKSQTNETALEQAPPLREKDEFRRPKFFFRFRVLLNRNWSVVILSNHTYTRIYCMIVWGFIFSMPYLSMPQDLKDSTSFDTVRALYVLTLFQATLTNNAGPVHEHWVSQTRAEMKLKLYEAAEAYMAFYILDAFLIVVPGAFFLAIEMWLMASFNDKASNLFLGVTCCILEHLAYTTFIMYLITSSANQKAVTVWNLLL
ncbi:hypothetical protein CYMTET_19513 [Cymbomonas tetramitiformis]|uniref:ABC transporter domain-containing protein n=1 Tax=Cymbomonas tetramitiformis TaxID=36881 RepID=A0AAE0G6G2_9CHLO|nr:hypothetical protein CYMTET_19513 [Cymbomonas tetramitiformis]